MNVKTYLGDLVGGGLWMAESHIIAEKILEQLSEEEWKNLIIEENILQKKSPHTAIRYTRTIRTRLQPMGEAYINTLLQVSERAYVQLLMFALLCNSPIVVDFMTQSLAEAHRSYQPRLPQNAWDSFINDRIRAMPDLKQYSDSTLKKMGNNTIKALVESGYLNTSRKCDIQPVYLFPEVKEWLEKLHHKDLIPIMECTL